MPVFKVTYPDVATCNLQALPRGSAVPTNIKINRRSRLGTISGIGGAFLAGFVGFAAIPYQPSAVELQPRTCSIKGNISSSGERIYHVPGQRYYDATRIDTYKGERWFCSEGEARAAGWRKARV